MGDMSRTSEGRGAYRVRDAERSRQLHRSLHRHHHQLTLNNNDYGSLADTHAGNDGEAQLSSTPPTSTSSNSLEPFSKHPAEELHGGGGKHASRVKAMVYGGIDGILTTFATVASVAGGGLAASVVVIIGIAHLVADGFSMGTGDAMSTQAELDYNCSERAREKWEIDNNLEGEIDEMIGIYESKGVKSDDARLITTTLAKYEDVFLNVMMFEELHLLSPDDNDKQHADDSPLVSGFITMVSFIVFGAIPLVPYLTVSFIPSLSSSSAAHVQLIVSIVLTIATLFVLGIIKGAMVEPSAVSDAPSSSSPSSWWLRLCVCRAGVSRAWKRVAAGLNMMLIGTVTALASYGVSYLITLWIDESHRQDAVLASAG